eukprot:s756_g16.t3
MWSSNWSGLWNPARISWRLLPLLRTKQRFAFQQWYHGYCDRPDRPEDAMPLPPPVDDDIELNPPAGSERASSSWQGSWAELWQASEGQQAPCHGTGQTICMQCITAYADDLLIQWQIRAPEQLHEAIQSIVFVLQTLEDFGMQISVEKTVVLLGLKGPQVSQLLAQYTLKHPKKGGHALKLPLTLLRKHRGMLCPHADQALQRFLDWCSQVGISTGGLEVRCSPGRGRLLQAARRFVADEEMLNVPADAIISEGVAGQSYQASHWTLAVAHRLVEEDCLGSDSRFWPYVQLLLEGEPHDLEIMDRLPGVAGSLARERAKLRALQVAEICAAVPSCTPERAARAMYAVDLRTVYWHPSQVRALVPYFDFVNHSASPNSRWIMNSNGSLRLLATGHIEIGEEVTITYDSIPNARLLVTYGFVLEGEGPHRSVDMNLCFGQLPELNEVGLGAAPGVQVQILGNGALRRRAPLLQLRSLGLSEAALAEGLVQQVSAELEQWQAADAREDDRLALLIRMSIEVLQNFRQRVSSWMQEAQIKSIMAALGPPPEAVEVHSASEDSQDSG